MKLEQTFYQQVGTLIRQERLRHKYSQLRLATILGVVRQSVWNWEHGEYGITLHHLYHVATVLEVSVCDLLPKNDKNVVYEKDNRIEIENPNGTISIAEIHY